MTSKRTEYVVVRLTRKEAEALYHAAINSLASEEDAKAILGARAAVSAGFRALEKLSRATYGGHS